jgi:hypothetical protein
MGPFRTGMKVALLLPDDLVACSERNQVGEALHSNSGTVAEYVRDSVVQRKKRGHLPCSITD